MKKGKVQALCTWAVNNFPRTLKNRFLALARSHDQSGNMYLQYIINKVLREDYEKTKQEMRSDDGK